MQFSTQSPNPRIAVCCCSDNNSVLWVIVALHSVKRFHPNLDFFCFSNPHVVSEDNKALLQRYGIEFVPSTYDEQWVPNGSLSSITFLRLVVPDLLYEKGYDFTLYLDGDCFCIHPIDWDYLTKNTKGLAADESPTNSSLSDYCESACVDPSFFREKFQLTQKDMDQYAFNAGFLFWNNRYYVDNEISQKALYYYQEGANRLGFDDQSLLALMVIAPSKIPYFRLDGCYNYLINRRVLYLNPKPQKPLIILHFQDKGASVLRFWRLRLFIHLLFLDDLPKKSPKSKIENFKIYLFWISSIHSYQKYIKSVFGRRINVFKQKQF